MRFFSIYILSLLYSLLSVGATETERETERVIRDFDKAYYQPRTYGLNDFKVEVRIEGLSDKLSKQLIFGKVEDVYFEISWKKGYEGRSTDKKKVEVFGLPDGFVEIKSELTSNILEKIDFIAPSLWSDRFKGYDLSMSLGSNETRTIVARDSKGIKDAHEIVLVFDRDKKPTRIILKKPFGLEAVDLKFFKKPWSRGQWVVREYFVNRMHGPHTLESKSSFDYRNVKGFGLLGRIETTTRQILTQPGSKKSQTYERRGVTVMRFSNWRVNIGLKNDNFSRL